jgi:transcriptional regulator with XRE-family HTH domain
MQARRPYAPTLQEYISGQIIVNREIPKMDTNWFLEALDKAGLSQADLARHLTLAPSAVSRMLRGERQMKLSEAVKVAQFLGVTQEEVLAHASDESAPPPAEHGRRGRPPRSTSSTLSVRQDAIPIRGITPAGTAANEPVGYTTRPSNLTGVRDAYAMYMVGEALSPRYEQGWLLHVNPHKPATRGRDVVVIKRDGVILIKQFVGWEDDTLVLRQLHPSETTRLPRDEVVECHLIVGADQEG